MYSASEQHRDQRDQRRRHPPVDGDARHQHDRHRHEPAVDAGVVEQRVDAEERGVLVADDDLGVPEDVLGGVLPERRRRRSTSPSTTCTVSVQRSSRTRPSGIAASRGEQESERQVEEQHLHAALLAVGAPRQRDRAPADQGRRRPADRPQARRRSRSPPARRRPTTATAAITAYSGTSRFACAPPACSGIRAGAAATTAISTSVGQRRAIQPRRRQRGHPDHGRRHRPAPAGCWRRTRIACDRRVQQVGRPCTSTPAAHATQPGRRSRRSDAASSGTSPAAATMAPSLGAGHGTFTRNEGGSGVRLPASSTATISTV